MHTGGQAFNAVVGGAAAGNARASDGGRDAALLLNGTRSDWRVKAQTLAERTPMSTAARKRGTGLRSSASRGIVRVAYERETGSTAHCHAMGYLCGSEDDAQRAQRLGLRGGG